MQSGGIWRGKAYIPARAWRGTCRRRFGVTVAWMRACSESVWSLQKNNRAVRLEWVMLCVVLGLLIRLHILVLGCGVWAACAAHCDVGDTAAAG